MCWTGLPARTAEDQSGRGLRRDGIGRLCLQADFAELADDSFFYGFPLMHTAWCTGTGALIRESGRPESAAGHTAERAAGDPVVGNSRTGRAHRRPGGSPEFLESSDWARSRMTRSWAGRQRFACSAACGVGASASRTPRQLFGAGVDGAADRELPKLWITQWRPSRGRCGNCHFIPYRGDRGANPVME